MKHLLLTLLFFGFITSSNPANSMSRAYGLLDEIHTILGDDPIPFPWRVCEIPINNMYGIWAIFDENGAPLFLLQINSIKEDEYTRTITVAKFKYTSDFKDSLNDPVATGVGILSKSKMNLTAVMNTVSGQQKVHSLLYFSSLCDLESGRQKHEIIEIPYGKSMDDGSKGTMVNKKSFKTLY